VPVICTQTESSYVKGCRCSDCREAHTSRERARRHNKRPEATTEAGRQTELRVRVGRTDEDTLTRGQLYKARGWDL